MADEALEGKVAIVTGAGSPIGMGRAMALALLSAGARVTMTDINGETLARSAEEARKIGGRERVLPVVADAANPDDAEKVARETIEKLGGVHILVNNAGVDAHNLGLTRAHNLPFWELPSEAWGKVMAVNSGGPFLMARAVVNHLRNQKWGRIIGVTTSLDTMIKDTLAPYGPSKAAHEAFMAIIARELDGTGVTANVLVPGGPVASNFLPPDAFDRSKLIPPEVMGKPVLWLASEASDGISGRRFVAYRWDETLPMEQRLEKASAPVAWSQLGKQAVYIS